MSRIDNIVDKIIKRNGYMAKRDTTKAKSKEEILVFLNDSRIAKTEAEHFAAREIKQLQAIKVAASKLVQCFPEKREGEEQQFDIPRYVIDELEEAIINHKS